MILQWCCKGVAKIGKDDALKILSDGVGLRCRGWLALEAGDQSLLNEALPRLTEHNLDLHVNHYSYREAEGGRPFYESTPFISLSAGCVDRDAIRKTNVTHRALRTALEFALTDYSAVGFPRCAGWVFYCYVLISTNRAIRIPSVAEEIRELNHNRAYSDWYWQGEVAAKINVPSTQILCAVRWEPQEPLQPVATDLLLNLAFTHPSALLDERNML